MSHQLVFNVGITCQSCVATVNIALEDMNFLSFGLSNQRTDLTQKKLFIDFDPTQTDHSIEDVTQAIIKQLDDFGFSCELVSPIHNVTNSELTNSNIQDSDTTSSAEIFEPKFSQHQNPIDKTKQSWHWWFGGIGLTAGLELMILTVFTGGLSLPLMISLGLASTALTAVLGYQSFVNAFRHAYYGRTLTMDALFTISTIAILTVSIGAFFIPGLPMMFEASLMIFGFRHIGLGIEEALNQNTGVKQNFIDRVPKTVTLQDGKIINSQDIQPGDIIVLKKGDILPVDGQFLKHYPTYRNVIKTGSERTLQSQTDQVINAGAILEGEENSYLFRAETGVKHSYLAKLDNLLLLAQQNKAPIERYTDTLLNYFIPSVIALAVVSGLVVGVWLSPMLAVQCAAAVLVTACPCTLGMIVPMTMKIGMQKGLSHGVDFKTRDAIEQASHIDQVVFDLNGTLTKGMPQVTECDIDSHMPAPLLWHIVHLLEKDATHATGKTLSNYALEQLNNQASDRFSNIEVTPLRNGRKATIHVIEQDKTYIIGNAQCMRDNGISIKEHEQPIIYLSENQRIIAQFTVIDPLRKGAAETVEQLKHQGKKVYLLTGADNTTAEFYGKLLNIVPSNQFANQSPENKQEQINRLRKRGLVAMIGDGGNDAVAIKNSDLGIIRRSHMSDSLTDQQAQIVISDQTMYPVGHIFQIANQTMSTLKQNLWFSFTYNVGALVLTGGLLAAIGIAMNPALGAGLMVLQTSLILLNTYRLSNQEVITQTTKSLETSSSNAKFSKLTSSPVQDLNSPEPTVKDVKEMETNGRCQPSSCLSENHSKTISDEPLSVSMSS